MTTPAAGAPYQAPGTSLPIFDPNTVHTGFTEPKGENAPLFDDGAASDAVDNLLKVANGNPSLVMHPGLVQALVDGNATAQQSSAINSFMDGVNAFKKYNIALKAGVKTAFSPDEVAALGAMNVDPSAVQYSQADVVAQEKAAQVAANQAAPAAKPVEAKKHGGGWSLNPLHDVGKAIGDVADAAKTGAGDVLAVANKAWNVADTTYSDALSRVTAGNYGGTALDQQVQAETSGQSVIDHLISGVKGAADQSSAVSQAAGSTVAGQSELTYALSGGSPSLSEQRQAQMTAAGYDPTSAWSVLAFNAKGYAHSDTSDLSSGWDATQQASGMTGDQAVAEAEKYQENPKAYVSSINSDPTLTPEQIAAKQKFLSTGAFQTLVKQVQGRSATIGNVVARGQGLDPVKDPFAYAATAAATDTVAAFALDPTNVVVGGLIHGAKISQTGVKGFSDTTRIRQILTQPAGVTGVFRGGVQRGVQKLVDYGNELRTAKEAEDTVAMAKVMAKARAEIPGLYPLIGDMVGNVRNLGVDATLTKDSIDSATDGLLHGKGPAIDTYAKAVDYLSDGAGLMRLMDGRAAVEASLMPGAVSAFGYRAIKSAVAGKIAERTGLRTLREEAVYAADRDAGKLVGDDAIVSAGKSSTGLGKMAGKGVGIADVDPEVASSGVHLSDSDLLKAMPEADDAVSAADGTVISARAATDAELASTPASAARASTSALSPEERAQVAYNMRRYGRPTAPDGANAAYDMRSASPTAIAARTRLAANRWTSLLPRNLRVNLDSATDVDKVYKSLLTYGNKYTANLGAAQFASGNNAARRLVMEGLQQQIAHASGLARSESGLNLMKQMFTENQSYAHTGDIIDAETGRPMGLVAGHVINNMALPDFKAVRRAGAKLGLWDSVMGKTIESAPADMFMSFIKMFEIARPAAVPRNALEARLAVGASGGYWGLVKAKAAGREINRGVELDDAGKVIGRNELARTRVGDLITERGPIGKVRNAWGDFVEAQAKPEDGLRWLSKENMDPDMWADSLGGYSKQQWDSNIDMGGSQQVGDILSDGFDPVKRELDLAQVKGLKGTRMERTGYGLQSADAADGARRYSNAMHILIDKNPDVSRAAIKAVHDPSLGTAGVREAIENDPTAAKAFESLGYGKHVPSYDDPHSWTRASTPAEVALGKDAWAQKIIDDHKYLMTDKSGEVNQKVSDYIMEHGKAPDPDWITSHLNDAKRPLAVNAPVYQAVPHGGVGGAVQQFADAISDPLGKGFRRMVEQPIQRSTTSPVMMKYYAQTREALEQTYKPVLKAGGLTDEASATIMNNLARRSAAVQTEQIVDDPGLRSQLDVAARNFFSFSRAQQAMIRRYSQILWSDPSRARRVQLILQGAEHSGVVSKDQYGNDQFTYPASGVMSQLLGEVSSKIPGMGGFAQFPVSGNLLGAVNMITPGIADPFRFSLTPVVNIPMRQVFSMFPEHEQLWQEIDVALNGQLGANASAVEQVTPALFKKYFGAMSQDDQNGALASSMLSAIASLKAADPDGSKGLFPQANWSPAELNTWMSRVKAQTKNQLMVKAVIGAFAPAAPTAPTEGNSATQSDFQYHALGIHNLSDEYKSILNDTNGDTARANAIWAAMHPDDAVYTLPKTQSAVAKAYMPATASAMKWMEGNAGFLSKYKTIGSYFVPTDASDGQFDYNAYRAQLQAGLRVTKTPTEFLDQIQLSTEQKQYYAEKDRFTAANAEAKASGNTTLASNQQKQWDAYSTAFQAANPALADSMAAWGTTRATAMGQLGDLRSAVKNNDLPKADAPAVKSLLGIYDGYVAWKGQQGDSTSLEKARISAASSARDDAMLQVLQLNPNMVDLYNGVFRALNSDLPKVNNDGSAQ